MDKEINAKVEEFVKEYGKRELSMDEAAQVSGGSFSYDRIHDMCTIDGRQMSGDEFNTIIFTTCENSSVDLAIDVLHSITGFWCDEMGTRTHCTSDMNRMGVIMDRFWGVYKYGDKH